MIKQVRPTYEVSVGAGFFCVIENREGNTITYEEDVWRMDTIRTLNITPTVNEGQIWASGTLFEHIVQITGAEITTDVVALPSKLLNQLMGAKELNGFTLSRTNDLEKEFAFGYWGENRDGTLVFYWHPVCKIAPSEETKETRNEDTPDPEKSYTITVIPFGDGEEGGLWHLKYEQKEAIEKGLVPLNIEQFFTRPIFTEQQIEDLTTTQPTPSTTPPTVPTPTPTTPPSTLVPPQTFEEETEE